MAKANPTLLGSAKNRYIPGAGESFTFIRCDKCNTKYVREKEKTCPLCAGKGGVEPVESGTGVRKH